MASSQGDEVPAERYIQQVLNGEVLVCEYVRLTVERHVKDLERSAGEDFPFYFDPAAAQRVIDFFQFCKHVEGEWAGQPLLLEPWQQFALWVPFGWKRKESGLRRYRKAYVEVSRKNGKSSWTAGLGLYFLVADNEPGAQVYSAATTRDQAKIIHTTASRMVRLSEELASHVQVYKNNLSIPETFSKFEPLSADYNTLDGLSPSAALIDEIHAHRDRGVLDVLETAFGARRQPMMWMITTAGINVTDSIALEFRNYGIRILKGIVDDETFFPLIYTLDDGDDWLDEGCWPKANPNLNVSVKLDEMRELALKAKEVPSSQNNFKTKRLNIWCSSRSRWVPVERWDECRDEFLPTDLYGRECYAGLDLSTTTDVTALSLVFPWENDTYRTLAFFWIPAENAHTRARRDRVPYPLWIEQGFIEATPGNVIDYDLVRKRINDLGELFPIKEIAADRWNATQILQQLEGDGFKLFAMGQGFASMTAPSKQLEALVLSKRIQHNGNPVLRWMFDNVSMKMDAAGNVKPDKEASAERIDGIVALIMAVDRASLRRPDRSPTILLI